MHTEMQHGKSGRKAMMRRAESVCRDHGARFTALRRRVFELIVEADQPLTAYELLARLASDGGNPAPPTVYRALEFLQEHGLVHRLASQSRWVVCDHPDDPHGGLFLVCSSCGRAVEWADETVASAVQTSAHAAGFRLGHEILPEVEGLCGQCHGG